MVRDYIYKDIYQHIFQQDENLLSLHEFFWNMRDDKQTIEKCHSLFDDKIECKELIDSFNDCEIYYNEKIKEYNLYINEDKSSKKILCLIFSSYTL